METTSIKSLAGKVLQRNSQGNRMETQSFPDRKLDKPQFPIMKTGNYPDCFSLNGTLESAISEARADGWTDNQLMQYVDALRQADCLKAPWGFKVKGSRLIGDYWIISDTTARERIPTRAISFTLDELRPIVEASRIFEGAKVIKVIRHRAINS